MSVTSKTGLLLSTKTASFKKNKEPKPVDFKNIASPAPFILRPFAGLYNPFPYGCSVLCNHPADCEAKGILRRAKQAWVNELKSNVIESRRLHKLHDEGVLGALDSEDLGTVPEELFRRYTDTDSRPLTPAPTLTSILSASGGVGGRRCVTPDPNLMNGAPSAERTQLVLDLRRSQSHETLTWPEEKLTQSAKTVQSQTRSQTPSSLSSKSRVSSKKSRKSGPKKETPEKTITDQVPEILKAHIKMESEKLNSQLQLPSTPNSKDQGTLSDKEDEGVVKRRGKPRKKRKKNSKGEDMSTELNQEFKGFAEPGETQMSAFVSESRAGSGRHSMSVASALPPDEPPPCPDGNQDTDAETEDIADEAPVSFIQPEILKHLQREIDVQMVDNEFNTRKQKALAEALRINVAKTNQRPNSEIKVVKNEVESNVNSAQSLLTLPRTFSRQSARFELPLDTSSLESMTPLEYINQHVIVTRDRRLFYNLVFECNKEKDEDEENRDAPKSFIRNMATQRIKFALSQMMGRQVSEEDLAEFEKLVGWSSVQAIDFRTWSGISALCERLLGPKYCTKYPSKDEDRCHDIEKADFDTLPRKLKHFKISPRLTNILTKIADSG